MCKQLFNLNEAQKMTTDALNFFNEVRLAKVGDYVIFDGYDHKGYKEVKEYIDRLNLKYYGCIMDNHGYKITNNTDNSIIPDVSEIIKIRMEKHIELQRKHLINI